MHIICISDYIYIYIAKGGPAAKPQTNICVALAENHVYQMKAALQFDAYKAEESHYHHILQLVEPKPDYLFCMSVHCVPLHYFNLHLSDKSIKTSEACKSRTERLNQAWGEVKWGVHCIATALHFHWPLMDGSQQIVAAQTDLSKNVVTSFSNSICAPWESSLTCSDRNICLRCGAPLGVRGAGWSRKFLFQRYTLYINNCSLLLSSGDKKNCVEPSSVRCCHSPQQHGDLSAFISRKKVKLNQFALAELICNVQTQGTS